MSKKALLLLLIIPIGFLYMNTNMVLKTITKDQGIKYFGYVCVYAKHNGVWKKIACNHNVLTDTGKDMILDRLAHGGFDNITYIALGNGTAPVSTDTALNSEWTTCGLSRAQANEFTRNDYGNWSIAYTWTSTCDNIVVNTTGLYNSTGSFFAGTSFPSHTLYNGDSLKVTWTISVS